MPFPAIPDGRIHYEVHGDGYPVLLLGFHDRMFGGDLIFSVSRAHVPTTDRAKP